MIYLCQIIRTWLKNLKSYTDRERKGKYHVDLFIHYMCSVSPQKNDNKLSLVKRPAVKFSYYHT